MQWRFYIIYFFLVFVWTFKYKDTINTFLLLSIPDIINSQQHILLQLSHSKLKSFSLSNCFLQSGWPHPYWCLSISSVSLWDLVTNMGHHIQTVGTLRIYGLLMILSAFIIFPNIFHMWFAWLTTTDHQTFS